MRATAFKHQGLFQETLRAKQSQKAAAESKTEQDYILIRTDSLSGHAEAIRLFKILHLTVSVIYCIQVCSGYDWAASAVFVRFTVLTDYATYAGL